MAGLSKKKYDETKKLLKSKQFNREEIAQQMLMSHTIVSRVNRTKNYKEYLELFSPNKTLSNKEENVLEKKTLRSKFMTLFSKNK